MGRNSAMIFCRFLAGFFLLSSTASAGVFLTWAASPDTNAQGYFVYTYTPGSSPDRHNRIDAGTNEVISVELPSGPWYATVTAYNTNNPNGAHLESVFSAPVLFFVPGGPGGLHIDGSLAYQTPIVNLTTNPAALVQVWLDATSNNPAEWSHSFPGMVFAVGEATNANFRARLTITPP